MVAKCNCYLKYRLQNATVISKIPSQQIAKCNIEYYTKNTAYSPHLYIMNKLLTYKCFNFYHSFMQIASTQYM